LRPNKANYALIPSNAWIKKKSTKQTQTAVYFKDINLIKNGTPRNIKKTRKLESSQFVQLWAASKHDYQKS